MNLPDFFSLFTPTIETENLTKIYGQKSVVKNLSLSVKQGDIFTLLGANGSGKSMAVKMLTGLLKPTSGDARILGQSILAESVELKKQTGVLPEGLAHFLNFLCPGTHTFNGRSLRLGENENGLQRRTAIEISGFMGRPFYENRAMLVWNEEKMLFIASTHSQSESGFSRRAI
ncbi:MAG TPA: ATP-binding cassette domain-containing protein [Pyrinomonadaceae bacterium]|jgi:ABC-type multidrug transport system ATPase subunit